MYSNLRERNLNPVLSEHHIDMAVDRTGYTRTIRLVAFHFDKKNHPVVVQAADSLERVRETARLLRKENLYSHRIAYPEVLTTLADVSVVD